MTGRRRRRCSLLASHGHGQSLFMVVALAAAAAVAATSTSSRTPGFVPSLSRRVSMLQWSKNKRPEQQQPIASTQQQYQGGGGGGGGGDADSSSSSSRHWSGIVIPPLVVPPPIPLPPSLPVVQPAAAPNMQDDILFYPPSMSSPSAMSRRGGGGSPGDLLERPSSPSQPRQPPPQEQQQQQQQQRRRRRQQAVAPPPRVPARLRAPPPKPAAAAPPPPPATHRGAVRPQPAAAPAKQSPPPPTAPRISKAKATPSPPPAPLPRQQQQQQQQQQQKRARQPPASIKPSLPQAPSQPSPQSFPPPPPSPPTLTAQEQEAALRLAAAQEANQPRSSFFSRFRNNNDADTPSNPNTQTRPLAPEELSSLQGVVKRITFASSNTGFTVLRLEKEDSQELITVVGNFGPINVGAALSVRGEWRQDAKWGRQLRAVGYEETAPATQEGIENYLASGLVKGIGPVAAKQIVGHFGVETLNVLNENPERLVEVEGIGAKKVQMIIHAWQGQKEVTAVMLFLQSHNVTTTLATKIYKKYGNDSVDVLRVNPYQLADEMEGVGFRTVDKIAAQLPGFDAKSVTRYRSGLLFILKEQANEGHCYGTRGGLLREGAKLLGGELETLDGVIEGMIAKGDLVAHGPGKGPEREKQCLFLPFFDMCEMQTAYRIQELMALPPDALRGAFGKEEKIFAEKAARAIEKTQAVNGITFDSVQLQGLMTAAKGRFTVLTGGPGTGKTTMALAIIRLFQGEGASVALAAPTGRAAQRLADGTGLEAKTIHRLLEYSPETKAFGRGAGNKLDCDVLVVDEASMVDIVLMYHLLAALPSSASVVLVGDVDQLPPVGPGNVLRDIIDSQQVEVVRLTNIFRQAEQSKIVMNAHRINRGEMPDFGNSNSRKKRSGSGGSSTTSSSGSGSGSSSTSTGAAAAKKVKKSESDFFLIEEDDPTKLVELITELCQRRLPKHYKLDPINDIQVLCPMKKGEVGTFHLNTLLQRTLNPRPPPHIVRYGGREFRVGDKVMQVKNNYEKNVFNGGVGTIVEVKPAEKHVFVCFDGHDPNGPPVSYDATELDQIMLSYAATVHKAQGSEYRVVVAPLLHRQHNMMLQRNLLYTCVTRAKEVLVLVGEKAAIAKAVANNKVSGRNSLLQRRLRTPKGVPLIGGEEEEKDR